MDERNTNSITPNSANDSAKENSAKVVKKKLPQIDMATQAKLAQKMIDPKSATPKGGHNYGPYFLEYCLMAEYDLLHKQKSLSGVYVIPSALTPLMWHGVMFIRQGLYQGGVYRFQLFIPDTYPDADCPSVIFDPPVYHPIINPSTGELDVQRAFPKWNIASLSHCGHSLPRLSNFTLVPRPLALGYDGRHVNHVWQVLMYAKRSFYKIDTMNPLNEAAAKKYDSDLEYFKYEIAECNKRCMDKLYDSPKSEDPHLFRFEPWDHFKHDEARKKLYSQKETSDNNSSPKAGGLSWMTTDRLGPFQQYHLSTAQSTT